MYKQTKKLFYTCVTNFDLICLSHTAAYLRDPLKFNKIKIENISNRKFSIDSNKSKIRSLNLSSSPLQNRTKSELF